MAVNNLDVVDIMSIDLMGNAVLTISDDLLWDSENKHLLALQDKINAYLGFIESGNIYESYPAARDRNFVINIFFKFEPNSTAINFLGMTKELLQSAGYEFQFSVLE